MKEKEPTLFLRSNDVSRSLCKAFNKIQMEDVAVSKGVKELRKLLTENEGKSGNHEEFLKYFTHLLRLPLSRGSVKDKMSSYDEKIFEVACQFATSFLGDDKEDETAKKDPEDSSLIELPPFLRDFFDWLLDHHEVVGSGARLKICLLVNRLLKLLGEEAEIDDELYQKIYDNMLERLKDKVADIRAQAVNALQRLQDPRDESCPIIKAFIFHMGCDPSPLVRKAIVRCIGATRLTLPHVIKRTLDVDENVRKAAYKFIADKVHIRSLSISKREEIVRRGLTDRNENVRNVVAKDLVPSWLRYCNDSIVELLYKLDVGNSDGNTAKEVLLVLFKDVPYEELVGAFQYLDPEKKLVPHGKLTPETATYWRNLVTFLHRESEVRGIASAGPFLEKILPELSSFCAYVRQHFVEPSAENNDEKEMMWLFVGRQLVEMFSFFDLADEAGRNNLLGLVKELLLKKSVPQAFVEPLMKIHRTVQSNVQQRIQDVAEIISELRDPMKVTIVEEEESKEESLIMEEDEPNVGMSKVEKDRMLANQNSKKMEMAKIRVKLNILKDDLDSAIRDKDFMKAQNLQLEIDELDEKLQELSEELALLVVPRSVEKKITTKARAPIPEPPVTQPTQQPKEEDPEIICKCLMMLFQLMQSPDINTLNATLQTIMDEFVKNTVSHLDVEIKVAGLKTLGSFCLRSVDLAKQYILLFSQIALVDMVTVRVTALEAIFDLLMWYGVSVFVDQESMLDQSIEDQEKGSNPILSKLSELLDDRDLDVRTKVTEGLCKLMMSKVITSSKLFTRLILMWYNPVTDTNGKLRHVLGAFFPLYASLSKENQEIIGEAFMPTLKTLGSAPVTSPLTGVDMEDVGLFFIHLTHKSFLQGNQEVDDNCHDAMAYALCNQIIGEPLSFHVKLYSKLLTNLNVSTDDSTKLKELNALYQQMSDVVKDKICVKTLEKFGKKVQSYIEQNPSTEETNNRDEEQDKDTSQMNNTTRIGKKRALFSQTCNTMLEEISEEKENNIKDMVENSEVDEVFATPKVTKVQPCGEIEITRVEESPLDKTDEIVSGNMMGAAKKIILESDEDDEDEAPVASTQIDRQTTKRLTRSSSTGTNSTEEEAEDEKKGSKRSVRGKIKPVEQPRPQRKSRRLDSSTGSSEEDSSVKGRKKRSRK